MKIITVPHQTLRQVATPVTGVDQKLKNLIKDLGQTLANQREPQGVGLAANQVDVPKRLFATNFTKNEHSPANIAVLINPEISDHSTEVVFGPNKREDVLEGCLSIPKLYGPAPRYQWVTLKYQLLVDDELQPQTEKFMDFEARVIQHELDHLNGILFTDYSLKYDLPVYQENKKTGKLEEIDKRILEAF